MSRPLFGLYAGRPRPYLSLVGVWVTTRLTILATGLLLQAIFDSLATDNVVALVVWSLVAVLVASEAARLFLWYGVILSRMEPGYVCTIQAGLQDRVLSHVSQRPAAVALDRPSGDVVSRLGGDSERLAIFGVWSASNVSRLLLATVAIGIMVNINPLATLGLVAPIVLVATLARTLNHPLGRYTQQARAAAGTVSTVVADTVDGVQAVRAARAESRMLGRLQEASRIRWRAEVRSAAFQSLQRAVFGNTAAFATGLVLLLTAAQMRSGAFTVGDLALFVYYIRFIAEAVEALGVFMGRARQASVSLERVGEIAGGARSAARCEPVHLDHPPAVAAAPERIPLETLSVTGLTYRHSGGVHAVRDVDLEIARGSVTVVIGRVGSGKSTLVRAVLGLVPVERGEVRWNGTLLRRPAEFLVPPQAAYVPQEPRLFSGSLRENVLLGMERDDAEVREVLAAAAFGPDLSEMPDGLDTVIGPRGLRLSGGQAQRLAIARALLREPELLVLDDCATALDVGTARELWARLRQRGHTLLVVATRPDLLTFADQVVGLAGGQVVASGPPGEVEQSGRLGAAVPDGAGS